MGRLHTGGLGPNANLWGICLSLVLMSAFSPVAYSDGQVVFSVSQTIELGWLPRIVAVNPTTNLVYVAYSLQGDPFSRTPQFISVISGASGNVLENVTVAGFVWSIAINPSTSLLYLGETFGRGVTIYSFVSVIDANTRRVVANVSLGSENIVGLRKPTSIAVNPSTGMVYVANYQLGPSASPSGFTNAVSVIDGRTNKLVANISTGAPPSGVAVDSVTNRIYAAHGDDFRQMVSVIDGATNKVIANVNGTPGAALDVDTSTHMVYAPDSGLSHGIVHVISGVTNRVVGNVTVGLRTSLVAVNSVTSVVYVSGSHCAVQQDCSSCCGGEDTIYAINGSTNTLLANLTVGSPFFNSVQSLAVNTATNTVYVGGYVSGNGIGTSERAGLFVVKGLGANPGSEQGGGIPEFPFQLSFTLLVTVAVVTWYVLARRGLRIGRLPQT